MKLTFKDLKQQKFTIEAEPSETIGQVKEKISADKGWEPSTQKLIYSGKILQDDNTIESYKIEEKGFIVCMTSKVCPQRAEEMMETWTNTSEAQTRTIESSRSLDSSETSFHSRRASSARSGSSIYDIATARNPVSSTCRSCYQRCELQRPECTRSR